MLNSEKNLRQVYWIKGWYWWADLRSPETRELEVCMGYTVSKIIRRASHSGWLSLPKSVLQTGSTPLPGFCPSHRPSCDQRAQFHNYSVSNHTYVSQLWCHIIWVCLPSALIKRGLIFQHYFGSSLAQHPHQEMLFSPQLPLWHVPSNNGDVFPQPLTWHGLRRTLHMTGAYSLWFFPEP